MVLAQRGGACALLAADRCSVHAARPSACRLYPLDASLGRRGGIRRLRIAPRGVECRAEDDGPSRLGEIRDAHRRHERELSSYHALVRSWNRAQGHRRRLRHRLLGSADFLAWLRQSASPNGPKRTESTTA
jgi:hypothetical protein